MIRIGLSIVFVLFLMQNPGWITSGIEFVIKGWSHVFFGGSPLDLWERYKMYLSHAENAMGLVLALGGAALLGLSQKWMMRGLAAVAVVLFGGPALIALIITINYFPQIRTFLRWLRSRFT